MITPTFDYENAYWQQGLVRVAGIDEVGRGAWAGPVVAAAAILSPKFDPSQAPPIRDSKTLSVRQRQLAANYLSKSDQCWTAIGQASVEEINQLGIAKATFLAMERAVGALIAPSQAILIDAFHHPTITLPQQAVVKGDGRCLSIAAASVVAKVFRDQLMAELAEQYPLYELQLHKGYGTAIHQQAILQHGTSPIHRTGYQLKCLVGRD